MATVIPLAKQRLYSTLTINHVNTHSTSSETCMIHLVPTSYLVLTFKTNSRSLSTGMKTSSPQEITSFVRSEEHTSELQSLMRISYAVFCLKKKKQYTISNTHLKHTNTHTNHVHKLTRTHYI